MAFLASARRWRPQRFGELVGQEHVSRTLQNALARGRVHHAYLFSGTRGVGKTTAARLLAKALNCEGGPGPEPCDACASCREVAEGRHPDVVEIDGASNTGVEDVRDLRERLAYSPLRGRRKVYIIDEVHMLSRSAFNALLKSLEEPPPHVVFVFATTEPRKVPETILSRCQQFDFRRIPLPLIEVQLAKVLSAEGREVEPGALRLIAQMAEGSMRDAQSLLDQVLSFAEERRLPKSAVEGALGLPGREACGKLVGALLRKDAAEALRQLADLYEEGQDLKLFCRSLLDHLRDLLVLQVSPDPRGVVVADEGSLEGMRAQAEGVGFSELHQLFSLLQAAEGEIRLAENPRMALEVAFIRMCRLEPLVPAPDLLERLERLLRAEAAPARGDRPAPPPASPSLGRSAGPPEKGARVEEGAPTGVRTGPREERGPTPGGEGEESDLALWSRLVSELDQRKPMLGSSLQGAEVRFPSRGLIEVSRPEGNGSALGMHIERHRSLIEEVAAELWGFPVRVRMGQGKAGGQAAPGEMPGPLSPPGQPGLQRSGLYRSGPVAGTPAGAAPAGPAPAAAASPGEVDAKRRRDALIQQVVDFFDGRVVEDGRGGTR